MPPSAHLVFEVCLIVVTGSILFRAVNCQGRFALPEEFLWRGLSPPLPDPSMLSHNILQQSPLSRDGLPPNSVTAGDGNKETAPETPVPLRAAGRSATPNRGHQCCPTL